jgi:hypothetical protein
MVNLGSGSEREIEFGEWYGDSNLLSIEKIMPDAS